MCDCAEEQARKDKARKEREERTKRLAGQAADPLAQGADQPPPPRFSVTQLVLGGTGFLLALLGLLFRAGQSKSSNGILSKLGFGYFGSQGLLDAECCWSKVEEGRRLCPAKAPPPPPPPPELDLAQCQQLLSKQRPECSCKKPDSQQSAVCPEPKPPPCCECSKQQQQQKPCPPPVHTPPCEAKRQEDEDLRSQCQQLLSKQRPACSCNKGDSQQSGPVCPEPKPPPCCECSKQQQQKPCPPPVVVPPCEAIRQKAPPPECEDPIPSCACPPQHEQPQPKQQQQRKRQLSDCPPPAEDAACEVTIRECKRKWPLEDPELRVCDCDDD